MYFLNITLYSQTLLLYCTIAIPVNTICLVASGLYMLHLLQCVVTVQIKEHSNKIVIINNKEVYIAKVATKVIII